MADTPVTAVYHDLNDPAYTTYHHTHDVILDKIMSNIRTLGKNVALWEQSILETWHEVLLLEEQKLEALNNLDNIRLTDKSESGFKSLRNACSVLTKLENKVTHARRELNSQQQQFMEEMNAVVYSVAQINLKRYLTSSPLQISHLLTPPRITLRKRFYEVCGSRYEHSPSFVETTKFAINSDCMLLFENMGNHEVVNLFNLVWRSTHPDEKTETYENKLENILLNIRNPVSHRVLWIEYLLNKDAIVTTLPSHAESNCRHC